MFELTVTCTQIPGSTHKQTQLLPISTAVLLSFLLLQAKLM